MELTSKAFEPGGRLPLKCTKLGAGTTAARPFATDTTATGAVATDHVPAGAPAAEAVASGGAAPGMAGRLTEGMPVFGAEGEQVGTIKEVRDRDFLLDRPMLRDVFVPVDSIRDATGSRVTLSIRAGDIDEMGWESPPTKWAGTTLC
ncbi:MAG: DUF2171 domain-containing protein [Chloroflexi bacterium]|nr:DUF2171 domain-containing protein [Chloroflexota bacterium]